MSKKISKIAIIAPNKPFFGALMVQVPFYQHLKANFKDAYIKIYSPVEDAKIFTALKIIDEVEIYNRKTNKFRLWRSLNKFKGDLIINLRYASEITNIIIWLCKGKRKVGLHDGSPTRFLLQKTTKFLLDQYIALNYLSTLDCINASNRFGYEGVKRLSENSEWSFVKQNRLVCLMPGGGEGEHKRWGIENFCLLCNLVLDKSIYVKFLFITGPKEEVYHAYIKKHLPEDRYLILHSASVEDIVKAVQLSNVTVANDCGPSHLAQMCGVNYISIWGWENQHPYKRIMQWFIPRDNSIAVVAEFNKSIKSVDANRVLPLVWQYLE